MQLATRRRKPRSQALLASLTVQHNTVLEQIDAAARGAARGGVDLLLGDTLALAFDETGASTLSMSGSVCNAAGLGLAPLAAGTDVERAGRSQFGHARVAHAALRTRRRRFQRILRWSEPPKVFRQRAGDAERPLVQCGGDRQRARQQPRAVDAPGDRDIGARARPGIADQYFAIVEPLELFSGREANTPHGRSSPLPASGPQAGRGGAPSMLQQSRPNRTRVNPAPVQDRRSDPPCPRSRPTGGRYRARHRP
jgi:hypothetical protein